MLLKIVKFFVALALLGGLALAAAGAWVYFGLLPELPSIERLEDVRLQVPLRIYANDGALLAEFGEKRRRPLAIEDTPDILVNAFLAAEDDRFYEHPGVDYQGILRAALTLATTGKKEQGGSTITMQVARNYFLTPEKTYIRKLKEILPEKNFLLEKFFGEPTLDEDQIFDEYTGYAKQIEKYIGCCSRSLNKAIEDGANLLFEGAQGTLLDIDHGTYPYVTSSSTCIGGVCTGSGVAARHINGVIGITKAYCTRVGEGPFPSELHDEMGENLRKAGSEFGSTTGRPRRCGWFDAVALREAVRLNGMTGLAITKLDVLSELDSIKICTAYSYKGELIEDFPRDADILQECTPVYEEFPGWGSDICEAKSMADLPDAAKAYLAKLEELVNCPAVLVSVGPRRDQTIQVSNPFA